MRPVGRLVVRGAAMAALFALAGEVHAQVALTATRRDTLRLDADGTITTVFRLENGTRDTARVTPRLVLPEGWKALLPPMRVSLPPGGSDTWLAGIGAPANAPAGAHVIRAVLLGSGPGDSVVVVVPERRELELALIGAPSFAAAGDGYEARFRLHNRGNVSARVKLAATSSLGSTVHLLNDDATLAAGSSMLITARVISRRDVRQSIDDIVELRATDAATDSVIVASSHALIVPRASAVAEPAPSVPGTIALRASATGSGVSPLVLAGAGPIAPGSNTYADFAIHTPAGPESVFGERDEYRLDLTSENWQAYLGDQSRSFSPLTYSGQSGFGAEFRRSADRYEGAAYVRRTRWTTTPGTEAALMFGARAIDGLSGSFIGAEHAGGAHVGAVTGRASFAHSSTLEVESAVSDSAGSTGAAQEARLRGDYTRVTYDFALAHRSLRFAGPGSGASWAQGAVSVRPYRAVTLSMNANSQANTTRLADTVAGSQRLSGFSVDGDVGGRFSIGYESRSSDDEWRATPLVTTQQSVHGRAMIPLGPLDVHVRGSRSLVSYQGSLPAPAMSAGVEVVADLGAGRSVSVSLDDRRGADATSALIPPGVLLGAAAQLLAPWGVSVSATASANLPAGGSVGVLQTDVMLSHQVLSGATLMLRSHLTSYTHSVMGGGGGSNITYLEFKAPLHFRSGLAPHHGRVEGRVVDANTGRGLSNLLVHVGDRTVITDGQGRVSMSGMAPGKYAVSLESADRASPGMLVGDVAVTVDGGSRQSVFNVALTRGARVRASVRRLEGVDGRLVSTSDSLVDDGAFENIVIALEGTRDTLYRSTDADGRIDFGQVAPGDWTVRVTSADLPDFHDLDVDRYRINVRAGDQRDVEFHVVPRQRAVHFMGPEEPPVIRSEPEAKTTAPAPAPAAAQDSTPVVTPRPRMAPRQRNHVTSQSDVANVHLVRLSVRVLRVPRATHSRGAPLDRRARNAVFLNDRKRAYHTSGRRRRPAPNHGRA